MAPMELVPRRPREDGSHTSLRKFPDPKRTQALGLVTGQDYRYGSARGHQDIL